MRVSVGEQGKVAKKKAIGKTRKPEREEVPAGDNTKHTMRDVARLAGVSISTVSAVINGTPKVSPVRTQRVYEAMQSLDYQPDQIARSLKVGRSRTIGVVVPDITNAFYPEVIRGIEEAAHRSGYGVLLCDSNEDPAREKEHLSTLFSRRVDGVILACSDTSAAYDVLVARRFPLVFVDRIPKGVRQNAVSTNNIKAARMATRHLIELGHKRVAVLAGDLNFSTHAERLEGFRRAMHQAGLDIPEAYLRSGNLQLEDGYEAGLELLKLKHPPTAVFASNNKLLVGLLRAVSEMHVPCPGKVSVLGFDDHVWNQHFNPRLTSVAQPTYDIGRCAFEMLLARMEDQPLLGKQWSSIMLLDAQLKVRESTAPPASDGRKS